MNKQQFKRKYSHYRAAIAACSVRVWGGFSHDEIFLFNEVRLGAYRRTTSHFNINNRFLGLIPNRDNGTRS